MDWLFDHFQIVLIVGFAFASWLKHRSDQRAAEREERDARRDFTDGDYPADEDDGYEDMWQPPVAPSVPPPIARQGPPPLVREVTPPPLFVESGEAGEILKKQREIAEAFQKLKSSRAVTSGGAAVTRARRNAAQSSNREPERSPRPGTSGLSRALRNRNELRRAIVLREILGPPVGLP